MNASSESRRATWTMLVVAFVAFLGFGVLIPVVPLYARGFGADEFVIGLLIATYALMQFVFSPVLGQLSDRFGRRSVLLWTIAGNALAYVAFALAGNLLVLFVTRALNGVMSANVAVAQAYVADALPEDDRTRGFGLLGAAFGLGLVFGPALGGVFSSEAAVSFVEATAPPAFAPDHALLAARSRHRDAGRRELCARRSVPAGDRRRRHRRSAERHRRRN